MYYYQLILKRLTQLEAAISLTEQQLEGAVIGDIQVSKEKDYYRWRLTTTAPDGTIRRITIPKSDRSTAEQAAETTLLRAHLEDLQKEYKACKNYLSVFRPRSASLPEDILSKEQALMQKPGFSDLLQNKIAAGEKELIAWEKADYPNGHDHYPEQLNVKVWDGLMVRSKSERSLAMLLKELGLHFRYEWKQDLNGSILPDFSILHPQNRSLYYLEHAGLLNDDNYRQSHLRKLEQYASAGIFPGDRLLITYDAPGHPLDIQLTRYQLRRMFFS